ncbi:translesion error-prone DNA polymerase V autoproteolytic subunit [Stenotrophomonas aracearum]|uniref:Translesion error-prone DNA polymerase V autoproteolytic subunit n=1 Tax=Stenotrophomonas aracearum TaxID=3003272 RepID=A0ABY9Y917_9GAMM|nr:translesion error-prone DNA polymerase V autoproteolytic subunit [Stenotrophomonas sp. A5588]WNH47342.1 translesion error-prone DNA polymerase V autoproteolytic subunit [Stenotrophomonas sp. A5588]
MHPIAPPSLLGAFSPTAPTHALPVLRMRVSCGFPSPAEDFFGAEDTLCLNQHCISNPVATFFATAEGDSMTGLGIDQDDTLVVDRSLEPKHGDIVLVLWEGGFMVKRLAMSRNRLALHSGHPDHPPILVPPDTELDVWGVVTWSFKKQLRR